MRRAVSTIAILLALACAPPAFAHATVVSTAPPDRSTVATAPRAVSVLFDDPVTIASGNAVVASDGTSVMAGEPRTELSRHRLILPVRSLKDGDYSARWSIISDDGHFESGVLAFRVGSGGAPPVSVLVAADTNPSADDLLARWAFIGGILVAGGSALFVFLVTRARAHEAALSAALALVVAAAGGVWLLHATHDPASRFGYALQAAVLTATLGAIALSVAWSVRRFIGPAFVPALVLLAAPTLAGHALRPASDRWFSAAADLTHVVAAAFWIGGLVQLAIVLARGGEPGAARRFSRFALPAVVLIVLSGAGRAVVELSSVSQLWSTGYGRAIAAKSALLVVAVAVAVGSRLALPAPRRLLRSVTGEIVVLALLVGAVAVLTALRPGRDSAKRVVAPAAREVAYAPGPPRGTVVFADQAATYAVALAVRPGAPLRLTATVLGPSGYGVDGLDVRLSAGRRSAPATPCGHGCYAATIPLRRPRSFAVTLAGPARPQTVRFTVPGAWPPAPGTTFLRHASDVFRGLRSVVWQERLSSAPGRALNTRWRIAAPDRVAYDIRGGASGIVIGRRRWDRASAGEPWQASATDRLPQPTPPWGHHWRDVRVLTTSPRRLTASWVDPSVPAWFTATFDRATARPVRLRMTAAAHFMRHRYLAYNTPVGIDPPPVTK
ncbi:MAG TPA: copper resistance protein CopC [Gaiellaceae bacterium]|nr:copper resistance protein CopC [Gaiellaceae bacterium]